MKQKWGWTQPRGDKPQGPPGAGRTSQSLEENRHLQSKVGPWLPAWAALPLPSTISTQNVVFPGHGWTDLPFGEPKGSSQLCLAADGDVAAVVKLFLQLQALVVSVYHPILIFRPSLAW